MMFSKKEPAKAKAERTGWRQDLYDWLQLMTFMLGFFTLFFTFFGIVFSVSGNSMYPTLHHADAMLIQRIGYTPKQGDVVVICKEGFPSDQTAPIVKRVIATAGQEVFIDYDTNSVYVDGVLLEEDYLNFANAYPAPDEDHLTKWYGDDYMAELTDMNDSYFLVEENSIFVMGDNRNGSDDSRDARLGCVDVRYVVGRSLGVFFPFHRMKQL